MPVTQIKNNVIADNTIAPAKLSVSSAMKTFLVNATSVNLASTVTGTTGGGNLVFATNPTLVGANITGNLAVSGNISASGNLQTQRGTFQYGSPDGCLVLGADANNTIRTSNARKLASITAPEFSNTRIIEFFNLDSSSSSTAAVSIGGRTGGSQFAATSLSFVTAPDTSTNGGTIRMFINNSGNIGINTTSVNAAAQLQIDSTTRGFLPPRMTTTQRDAISTPPAGLMIYNTSTNRYNEFSGSAWQEILDSSNLGTGVGNFLATPTSANLALALTDENGTGGGFVRAEGATLTSPSLVGPVNLTSQDASTEARIMTRGLVEALQPFGSSRVTLSPTVGLLPLMHSRLDTFFAQGWGTNNVPAYFWLYHCTQPFQKMSFRQSAGTHPTAAMEIGVYNIGTNGMPSTLIQKGSVSLDTTGIKTVTLASPVVPNGLFFVVMRVTVGNTNWIPTGGSGTLTVLGASIPHNTFQGQITGCIDPSTLTQFSGTLVPVYSSGTPLPPNVTDQTTLAQLSGSNTFPVCAVIHN
jgi:hypothetical protein